MQHPLDPLTQDELANAVTVLRDAELLKDGFRLVLLELAEPDKDDVDAFDKDPTAAEIAERTAFAIIRDPGTQATSEVTVSLRQSAVVQVRSRTDIQPQVTAGEASECKEVVLSHPEFLAGLERRSITDTSLVTVDAELDCVIDTVGHAREQDDRQVRVDA
jgi:primary-amine oxidase